MKKLSYTVKRGKALGMILTPHRHGDGYFVVSMTRFEKDYIRVQHESELHEWIGRGYRVRMSEPGNPRSAASLIAPASITVVDTH
jgi:hypothetical protein